MKRTFLAATLTLMALFCLFANEAKAQYKNTMFGIGVASHSIFASKDVPSLQFFPSGAIGGESLFKMGQDHWWFGVKLHIGFTAHRDPLVREQLGVLMMLRAGLGVRYVILTDRIRPFIQLGGTYNRIFYFTDDSKASVAAAADTYLKHRNLGSLSLTPGVEFVYKRNMSIQVAIDGEWVIVYNDKQAFGLFPSVTFMFYM